MAAVQPGILELYVADANNWSDQSIINSKNADNIEILRTFAIGRKDITAINIKKIATDSFTINKMNSLIQYVGFSSVGAISGNLPPSTDIGIGSTFYLYNENATPATNTVTIALNAYTILNSAATSIVLNSSDYITVLIYIAENTFLASYISTIKPS